MATNQEVEAGQAVYTHSLLSLYDLWVLGFSNALVWRCPTGILRNVNRSNTTFDNDSQNGVLYYPKSINARTRKRRSLHSPGRPEASEPKLMTKHSHIPSIAEPLPSLPPQLNPRVLGVTE